MEQINVLLWTILEADADPDTLPMKVASGPRVVFFLPSLMKGSS
jgi:hypothetical protein